jgi:hypothetical protein
MGRDTCVLAFCCTPLPRPGELIFRHMRRSLLRGAKMSMHNTSTNFYFSSPAISLCAKELAKNFYSAIDRGCA